MRYVVYGAGAIGSTIGARLFEAGHEVVLIARGPHLAALETKGLRYGDPERTRVLRIPVVGHPSHVEWRDDVVVILATKSQDTDAALDALVAAAPSAAAIVCAQNGVENERRSLRRFGNVYGMCVMLPASHVEPGAVDSDSLPVVGVLDVGRYPTGVDQTIVGVANDLAHSGFRSQADGDIMRWKYEKLLTNLGSALRALCGPDSVDDEEASEIRHRLVNSLRSEALTCYERAGIVVPGENEQTNRWGGAITMQPVAGRPRGAGSAWQSLQRGAGTIETDAINGEIVLLGRLHAVPTPANATVQHLAVDAARRRMPPGSYTVAEIDHAVRSGV